MAKILRDKSLYYNDVNLIAQRCKVKSRSDIPKELNRSSWEITVPISYQIN